LSEKKRDHKKGDGDQAGQAKDTGWAIEQDHADDAA
jgi:hypothetical protein